MKTKKMRRWLRWERVGNQDYAAQIPCGVLLRHDSTILGPGGDDSVVSHTVLLAGTSLDALAPMEQIRICEDGDPPCEDTDCEAKHTERAEGDSPVEIATANFAMAMDDTGEYPTRVEALAAHFTNVVDTARERHVSVGDAARAFVELLLGTAHERFVQERDELYALEVWLHEGDQGRWDAFQLYYAADPYPCAPNPADDNDLVGAALLRPAGERGAYVETARTELGRRLAVHLRRKLAGGTDRPDAERDKRQHRRVLEDLARVVESLAHGEVPDVPRSRYEELLVDLRGPLGDL